jgi:hypothetical protein
MCYHVHDLLPSVASGFGIVATVYLIFIIFDNFSTKMLYSSESAKKTAFYFRIIYVQAQYLTLTRKEKRSADHLRSLMRPCAMHARLDASIKSGGRIC